MSLQYRFVHCVQCVYIGFGVICMTLFLLYHIPLHIRWARSHQFASGSVYNKRTRRLKK